MTDLSRKATEVAALSAAHDEASDTELATHAEALRLALAAVQPAISATVSWYPPLSVEGLRVARVTGRSDAWILLDRNGQMFSVTENAILTTPLSADEVVEMASLKEILVTLDDALTRQLKGKLRGQTAKINERTAKLKAILAVLK